MLLRARGYALCKQAHGPLFMSMHMFIYLQSTEAGHATVHTHSYTFIGCHGCHAEIDRPPVRF